MHLKTFTLWGIFSLLIVGSVFASSDKNKPITIAEKSNFESTSRYDDVINFITQLKKLSSNIRVETIAKTIEGKDIPLLVIGHPLPKSSKEIKNDKRTAVYIQANIHAGEVEGKEAALMFARDVLLETNPKFLDDIILLICPIFNADGNDKISTENRRNQNGPINGVGVRHNGQNLDLNRDAIKAETPEVKGMITNVLNRWDPAVMVDLHTTNGSYHEETITFTWMMNGNTDRSLINYMRDKMMPAISKTLSEKYNTMNCFYGEFVDMRAPEK